jgi:signal transduction histidine kinase
VRRLLRPLDDIRQGALRFGAGDFGASIPVRHAQRPDELGQLAATINTMGQDIHQMLEAKRALLLAISHELRSPLTRARLHTELLPATHEVQPQRDALLRDLGEMARLITDLLESERLTGRHTALHKEPTDIGALARAVVDEMNAGHPGSPAIELHVDAAMPAVLIDATRLRLLMRNLLDNALRYGGRDQPAPRLHLRPTPAGLEIEVRDFGAGVPEDQIERLAQPFYRADAARQRSTGGVGLGLYLCRLVAQAHGGTLVLGNARPGLRVTVTLPLG